VPNETVLTELEKAGGDLSARVEAITILRSLLWTPYLWGGDDFSGLDCSGLIVEVLKSVGKIELFEDLSADGLYRRFRQFEIPSGISPYPGCLVLWSGVDNIMSHVGMVVTKRFFIHAGGGGSSTTSEAAAIAQNAYVMQRDLEQYTKWRAGKGYRRKAVDPFKEA